MKKILLFLFIYLFTGMIYAQTIDTTEAVLQIQLDSILVEGNLLYQYEKAAWVSTDLAMGNRTLKKEFGGFFVYKDEDEIKVIILGKKMDNCIAEYIFTDEFNNPTTVKTDKRGLSKREKELIKIREIIINALSDKKYGITIPEGYSPNFILIPIEEGYKMYMIMGTSQNDLIPFGNDYLFFTNKKGEIENWNKFHTRMIPGMTSFDGNKVTEMSHSHIKTTPLITATDICTFMLYAPLYGIEKFSVYSPAIGKYMEYNLEDNKIYLKDR
ncbi:MAG: hypothetical protein H6Q25_1118 [Bacteroidetes bacterium]|nr:hypothetical protein [Bacteroidota bacterium]